MPDPLSIVLGAAIGSAAGKFVEKALDSGEKWLAALFADHGEKARGKGHDNASQFFRELAERVANLEKANQVSEQSLSTALKHPDFSVFFQKALLSAAQTDNRDKHLLLSRLVEERLQTSPESLLSLVSKMACNTISDITPNQLRILGLAATVRYPTSGQFDIAQATQWLQRRIAPLIEAKTNNRLDCIHLESLSCINRASRFSFLSLALQIKFVDSHLNFDEFVSTQLGQDLEYVWEGGEVQGDWGLGSYDLTTVGLLLGVMVGDEYSGTKTNFEGWGEGGTLVSNFLFP